MREMRNAECGMRIGNRPPATGHRPLMLGLMVAALFLLVYVCYAGKGSALQPGALFGLTVITESEIKKKLARNVAAGESVSNQKLRIKGIIAEDKRIVEEGCALHEKEGRDETDEEKAYYNSLYLERQAAIELHRMLEMADEQAGNFDGRHLTDNDREVPHHSLPGRGPSVKSLGMRFVENKEVREWQQGGLKGISPTIGGERAIIVSGEPVAYAPTSAGAFILPDRLAGVESFWQRPLSVLELIQMGTTGSTSVEHIKESFTNNAGMIAEATGIGDGSGGSPSSDLDFAVITDNVRDCAHDVTVTKNALMDAGQVMGIIDGDLRQGLREKVEDQVLAGDAVGQNLRGILARTGGGALEAGINIQAFDTNILATARKAKTKCRTEGKIEGSAYVISAQIDEDLDLVVDQQGRYYAAQAPFGGTPATLWALPRAVSLSAAVSTYGILGAWSKAWLFEHMAVGVYSYDQHSDYAKRRLNFIQAVWRVAFKVKREPAFTRIAWA